MSKHTVIFDELQFLEQDIDAIPADWDDKVAHAEKLIAEMPSDWIMPFTAEDVAVYWEKNGF